MKVDAVASDAVAPLAAAPAAAGPKATAAGTKSGDSTQGVKHIADEFERLLLMQMLRTSKVCGDEKGYGSMLVDALADGVMKGGGLGLSDTIVRSLERSVAASQGPAAPASVPPPGERSTPPPPPGEKSTPPASSPQSVVRSSG